jgi:acyl-CoA synthetase (AMP-forming)/AMP-acid ligase II
MLRTDLIASVPELLQRHAEARGSKTAFRDAKGAVSYADMAVRTGRVAGHLADHGIAPGDTVAILLPNSVAWVEAALSITRAGAVGVPVSYDSTEAEILFRLTDANCKAIIATAGRAELVAKLKVGAPNLKTVILAGHGEANVASIQFAELASGPAKSAPRDPSDIHTPAYIVYTSGTTGRAKGVLLSLHGMLWVVAACWAPITGLSERDVVLSPLPLFHSYARACPRLPAYTASRLPSGLKRARKRLSPAAGRGHGR